MVDKKTLANMIGIMTITNDLQRKVTIISSQGKRYSGFIDIHNPSLRTIDIFNSSSTFWKNIQDKYFDDSLLLHEAKILFSENSVYKEFTSLQLRTSKIIAFFDEFASIGSEGEKTRFESIKEKTGAKVHKIHIITTVAGNSFYEIDGLFNGILKKQSSQSFIPLTQAKVTEIVKKGGKWFRNPVPIRSQFLGINSNSIEAIDSSIAA